MNPACDLRPCRFSPVARTFSWQGAVSNFGDAPSDGDMSGTKLNGAIIAATGF
ncbi:MAG TPA: hypothetical protein VIY26_07775 [Acidimicrobiales bacterium]